MEEMFQIAARKALEKLGIKYSPCKEIFAENLEAATDGAYTIYMAEVGSNVLKEGENYSVTTGTGTFSAVCKVIEADETTYCVLGNQLFSSGEDTGESFSFICLNERGAWGIIAIDFNDGSHMKVEIPETIHPIDKKYLPEGYGGGGPVVIDLTKYKATNGYSFNDLMLSTLSTSVGGGGTLAEMNVEDAEGTLRKALTTDRQVIGAVTINSGGSTMVTKFPVSVTTVTDKERATVVSGSAILIVNETPYEIKYQLCFKTNADDVTIRCKATQFA